MDMEWSFGSNASRVLQCIFAVQQDANLTLTGRNTSGGGYDYAKLGDIKAAILPYLSDHECIFFHNIQSVKYDCDVKMLQSSKDSTPKPKVLNSIICTGSVTLVSVKDKEDSISLYCYGTKVDYSSDKTLGAHTIFRRYSLLSMFGLDVAGDDPDADENDFARHNTGDGLLSPITESNKTKQSTLPRNLLTSKGMIDTLLK